MESEKLYAPYGDVENIKSEQDFLEKLCRRCGTQRCEGVLNEEWREGCRLYKLWQAMIREGKQSNVQTI